MIDISVILPIYNTKKEYLAQCFDSLRNQSITDFEIICVDDGSASADTLEYLKEAENDIHFKVIHQENMGVSVARNTGFACSLGNYICFIDPDDWVEQNYLEKLFCALQKSDADFVMADCRCAYKNRTVGNRFLQGEERVLVGAEKNQILYQLVGKKICKYYPPEIAAGAVWGKMFKRSFLEEHDLKFVADMKRMQDNIFCLYAIEYAQKIHYLPQMLYFYRKEVGSACFSYSPNIIEYFEKYYDETRKFLDVFGKERVLYEALYIKELTSFHSYFSQYFFHKNCAFSKKEVRDRLNGILAQERYREAIKNTNFALLNIQEKIFIFCLKHRMYSILRILMKLRNRHRI